MRASALACLVAIAMAATPARADRGDRWDVGTMAWQVGGGMGGGLLGAGLFGLAGYFLGAYTTGGPAGSTGADAWGGIAGAIVGGIVGGLTGIVIGVDYAGHEEGGTGHWWGTTLGVVDGVATIALLSRIRPSSKAGKIAVAGAAVVFLFGTPVVGYQLSGDAHAARVVPLAGFTF